MVEKIVFGSCRRCGTCCRKGGPALHLCDKPLVDEGRIRLSDLYTIREGEPVYDNVKSRLERAVSDIIKIRSAKGSSSCLFYEGSDSSCEIYDYRPLECRVLRCWDTAEIEAVYDRNRLTRRDLLAGDKVVWEMVRSHQNECSYDRIEGMVEKGDTRGVSYLVRYDLHFRNLVAEKSGLEPALFDFLFGLPLAVTIRRYDIFGKREAAGAKERHGF